MNSPYGTRYLLTRADQRMVPAPLRHQPMRQVSGDAMIPRAIPACDARRPLFDATMERPDRRDEARAKEVCNSCPLLTHCRETYALDPEILGVVAAHTYAERFPQRPPITRKICGTTNGSRMHYKRGEAQCGPCRHAQNAAKRQRIQATVRPQSGWWLPLNESRIEDLRHLVATGSGLGAALRQLDVTYDTLRKWCQRNGHRDLWARLLENPGAAVPAGKTAGGRRTA